MNMSMCIPNRPESNMLRMDRVVRHEDPIDLPTAANFLQARINIVPHLQLIVVPEDRSLMPREAPHHPHKLICPVVPLKHREVAQEVEVILNLHQIPNALLNIRITLGGIRESFPDPAGVALTILIRELINILMLPVPV
jgi:hypothetical protein